MQLQILLDEREAILLKNLGEYEVLSIRNQLVADTKVLVYNGVLNFYIGEPGKIVGSIKQNQIVARKPIALMKID